LKKCNDRTTEKKEGEKKAAGLRGLNQLFIILGGREEEAESRKWKGEGGSVILAALAGNVTTGSELHCTFKKAAARSSASTALGTLVLRGTVRWKDVPRGFSSALTGRSGFPWVALALST